MLCISVAARAESTGDALRAFGLVGTWSEDCSADGERSIFVAPLIGTPRIDGGVTGGKDKPVEIRSAARVTEDKIKIALPVPDQQNVLVEIVFVKIGNKIRVWHQTMPWCGVGDVLPCGIKEGRYFGEPIGVPRGQVGRATRELERCIN
jgi:hypothetical protein